MEYLVRSVKSYKPRNPDKTKSKAEVLKNVEMFFQGRNWIVIAFEENIFPLPKKEMSQHEQRTEEKGENILLQKKDQKLLLKKKKV